MAEDDFLRAFADAAGCSIEDLAGVTVNMADCSDVPTQPLFQDERFHSERFQNRPPSFSKPRSSSSSSSASHDPPHSSRPCAQQRHAYAGHGHKHGRGQHHQGSGGGGGRGRGRGQGFTQGQGFSSTKAAWPPWKRALAVREQSSTTAYASARAPLPPLAADSTISEDASLAERAAAWGMTIEEVAATFVADSDSFGKKKAAAAAADYEIDDIDTEDIDRDNDIDNDGNKDKDKADDEIESDETDPAKVVNVCGKRMRQPLQPAFMTRTGSQACLSESSFVVEEDEDEVEVEDDDENAVCDTLLSLDERIRQCLAESEGRFANPGEWTLTAKRLRPLAVSASSSLRASPFPSVLKNLYWVKLPQQQQVASAPYMHQKPVTLRTMENALLPPTPSKTLSLAASAKTTATAVKTIAEGPTKASPFPPLRAAVPSIHAVPASPSIPSIPGLPPHVLRALATRPRELDALVGSGKAPSSKRFGPAPTYDLVVKHAHPSKEGWYGVPPAWGLSAFGLPKKDARTVGHAMQPGLELNPARTLREDQDMAVRSVLRECRRSGFAYVEAACAFGKSATLLKIMLELGRTDPSSMFGQCSDIDNAAYSDSPSSWTASLKDADFTTAGFKAGRKAVWVVDREELMQQARDDILGTNGRFGWCPQARVGWIQESYEGAMKAGPTSKRRAQCDFADKDIVIVSQRSLASCTYPQEFFDSIGTVIVDEAESVATEANRKVLQLFHAAFVVGCSATNRKDGLQHLVHWHLGATVFAFQRYVHITGIHGAMQTLVVDGDAWNTRPRYFTFGDREADYDGFHTDAAFNGPRNAFIVALVKDLVLKQKKPRVVLFTRTIAHVEELSRLCADALASQDVPDAFACDMTCRAMCGLACTQARIASRAAIALALAPTPSLIARELTTAETPCAALAAAGHKRKRNNEAAPPLELLQGAENSAFAASASGSASGSVSAPLQKRRVVHVHSQMSDRERKQARIDAKAPACRVIIGTCDILGRGYDDCLLDAGIFCMEPNKTLGQLLGRLLRERKLTDYPHVVKKGTPLLIDVVDRWALLQTMSSSRCKTYSMFGYDIKETSATALLDMFNARRFEARGAASTPAPFFDSIE